MGVEDGGPAFPCEGYGQWAPHPGMSLRDWFAGHALAGIIANPGDGTMDQALAGAWLYADRMIAERSKNAR
jgi:hypothetical protein